MARATPSSSRATPSSSREPAPFNLLLMVADPVGNAAPITEDVARSDLTNLWTGRVQNIDEVTTNLFLAGFVSEGDMMSIIRGQPWTLRSHNLLIEMYVPDRERDDYAFQYLDASIRLYGIPRELRTKDRIREIIQHIGHASDWHRLNPRSFNYDPFYVPVRIKLDVSKPAKDKIFHFVPNMGNMIIWLHYEKVKRICTYCARFFHNAEHCPGRVRRIMIASGNQGFNRYGN